MVEYVHQRLQVCSQQNAGKLLIYTYKTTLFLTGNVQDSMFFTWLYICSFIFNASLSVPAVLLD